jgi:hypothetical protein
MALSQVSGIMALRRGLAAYFAATDVAATVHVGWLPRGRQDNQGPGGANRVVLVPGEFDPTSGAPKVLRAGRIDREGQQNHVNLDPRYRAVGWAHDVVTVSCWGVDPERPNDEERQIEATLALREVTVAGLHNAVDPLTGTPVGFANIEEWGEAGWTLPPVERAFGREYTFGLVLLVPLFDAPVGLAYPQPAVARNPAM